MSPREREGEGEQRRRGSSSVPSQPALLDFPPVACRAGCTGRQAEPPARSQPQPQQKQAWLACSGHVSRARARAECQAVPWILATVLGGRYHHDGPTSQMRSLKIRRAEQLSKVSHLRQPEPGQFSLGSLSKFLPAPAGLGFGGSKQGCLSGPLSPCRWHPGEEGTQNGSSLVCGGQWGVSSLSSGSWALCPRGGHPGTGDRMLLFSGAEERAANIPPPPPCHKFTFVYSLLSAWLGEDQKALFISLWGVTIMAGLQGGSWGERVQSILKFWEPKIVCIRPLSAVTFRNERGKTCPPLETAETLLNGPH